MHPCTREASTCRALLQNKDRRVSWVLGIVCLAAVTVSVQAQYYGPSGGSRKSISLRSNLQVGQGPSTIHTQQMQAYSFGLEYLPGQTPATGSGVLGSSIYGRQSTQIRPGGAGAPTGTVGPSTTVAPMSRTIRYKPTQPLRISSGGSISVSGSSWGSPLLEPGESVSQPTPPRKLPTGRVTSLVSKIPWESNPPLARGEKLLKEGRYSDALAEYTRAYNLAPKRPAVLLSLFHLALAMADGNYTKSAEFLAVTLKEFPHLPLVDVHPRDFIAAKGEYERVVDRLETHVRTHPLDPSAALVLGYLRMRDNLVPSAGRLLEVAAKEGSGDIVTAANVLLKAVSQMRQEMPAMGPDLAEPILLRTAGLKLALPEGFALQPLNHANQILVAVKGAEGTTTPRNISITAHAVDSDVTLHTAFDGLIRILEADPGVSNLTQFDRMDLTYLELPAMARLYSCTYLGQKVVMVKLCFIRELPSPDSTDSPVRLLYVLSMGLLESDIEVLLPTFSAFARSVSLVSPVSPDKVTDGLQTSQVDVKESGFSIGQPLEWAGRRDDSGYHMFATDWAAGGGEGPSVEVIVFHQAAATDAKSLGESAIARKQAAGESIRIAREAPAQLGGLAGHEFLLRRPADGDSSSTLELVRLLVLPASGGKATVYALTARDPGGEQADLEALMNLVAKSFVLDSKKTQ